jgi:superfamily II DNA or RNA helicase
MVELRPYQQKFVNDVRQCFASGKRKVMGRIPTGAGKSPTFGYMLEQAHQKGRPSVLIVHRDELLRQGVRHLEKSGIPKDDIGVIKAGYKPNYDRPIQVASIQSVLSGLRLEEVMKLGFNFLVYDEGHHLSENNSYHKLMGMFDKMFHLFVTATPARGDGKGFANLVDEMVEGPTVRELMDMGYLAEYDMYSIKEIDLTDVTVRQGDYAVGELQNAMRDANIMGDIAPTWHKYAGGVRTITFGINTDHVKEITKELQAGGVPADWIDYRMPLELRREKIIKLIKGEILNIVNCNIFSEGFDISTFAELEGIDDDDIDIGAVQLLRPTKSTVLDNQQKGRCLRIPPSLRSMTWLKRGIILDHANSLKNHGLPDDPHVWSLEGVQLRRQEDREQIAEEERAAKAKREREEPIHDRNGELVLIDRNDLVYRLYLYLEAGSKQAAIAKWLEHKPSIENIAKANEILFGYKGMWCYRLWLRTGARPKSMAELRGVAKLLGFNWQWSKHEAARLANEEAYYLEEAG